MLVSTYSTRSVADRVCEMTEIPDTTLQDLRSHKMLDYEGLYKFIHPVARVLQGTRIPSAALTTIGF